MDIKIDIKDDRHFTDVVSVIDRDSFEAEVIRIRKALNLKLPLSDKYLNTILSKKEEKKIGDEIEKSRKKLLLPRVFSNVIYAVVFRNEITDQDYTPAYLISDWNGENFDPEGRTPDETYYIVLSPGARDKDILNAYKKYRDELGNFEGVPQYKHIHQVWPINKKKPSIRKHREWYVAYKSGTKIEDIASKEDNYDNSTIRKAIEAYKSFVWKVPTF